MARTPMQRLSDQYSEALSSIDEVANNLEAKAMATGDEFMEGVALTIRDYLAPLWWGEHKFEEFIKQEREG